MKSLIYKEFHLTIHPLFYLMPLLGALVLIPQWPYFISLMYFFFIAAPNIFTTAKAQNDTAFLATLPVRRSDIVKSRFISVVFLELLQIFVTSIFVFINMRLYPAGNFLMDANVAFIGLAFVMYGVYNAVMFPMFYKTAYKIAAPTIVAITAAVLFAFAVEVVVLLVPCAKVLDGTQNLTAQLPVLAGGIILFVLMNMAAFKLSVKRFERVNI